MVNLTCIKEIGFVFNDIQLYISCTSQRLKNSSRRPCLVPVRLSTMPSRPIDSQTILPVFSVFPGVQLLRPSLLCLPCGQRERERGRQRREVRVRQLKEVKVLLKLNCLHLLKNFHKNNFVKDSRS